MAFPSSLEGLHQPPLTPPVCRVLLSTHKRALTPHPNMWASGVLGRYLSRWCWMQSRLVADWDLKPWVASWFPTVPVTAPCGEGEASRERGTPKGKASSPLETVHSSPPQGGRRRCHKPGPQGSAEVRGEGGYGFPLRSPEPTEELAWGPPGLQGTELRQLPHHPETQFAPLPPPSRAM